MPKYLIPPALYPGVQLDDRGVVPPGYTIDVPESEYPPSTALLPVTEEAAKHFERFFKVRKEPVGIEAAEEAKPTGGVQTATVSEAVGGKKKGTRISDT